MLREVAHRIPNLRSRYFASLIFIFHFVLWVTAENVCRDKPGPEGLKSLTESGPDQLTPLPVKTESVRLPLQWHTEPHTPDRTRTRSTGPWPNHLPPARFTPAQTLFFFFLLSSFSLSSSCCCRLCLSDRNKLSLKRSHTPVFRSGLQTSDCLS